jgi:transposase
MHFITPENRNQISILRPTLDEMIDLDSEIRLLDVLVTKIVDENPSKFQYKGKVNIGRKAYSSESMLKLYLYGYLNRVNSSRRLEKECHRNIELMWLLGNLTPDFKTIANYRKDNSKQIRFLTRQFRLFLRDKEFIDGATIAIDGTKIKANANRNMINRKRLEKRLSKLSEKMDVYLDVLKKNDLVDTVDGVDAGEGSEPTSISDKISVLQKEIQRLDAIKKEMDERGVNDYSPTDPDAKKMKSRDGFAPCHNVQAVTDGKHHMIAELEVCDSANDLQQLEPMVERFTEELEVIPKVVLGDKGFANPDMIERIEKAGETVCFIPSPKSSKDKEEIVFTYDEEADVYICPEGKHVRLKSKNQKKNSSIVNIYQCSDCEGCPLRSKCTQSKIGRIINRYHNQEWRDNYRKKMKKRESKEQIARRKGIVEHPFGTIKMWMGKQPLRLRGKPKVQIEMDIYATVYNLRRLLNIVSFDNFDQMVRGYSW